MLLGLPLNKRRIPTSVLTVKYRTQSIVTALARTDRSMKTIRREKWTEEDIDALPQGEHDYFERKSGLLVSDPGAFFGKLAKTISALANRGGGHIILGVDDSGVPDGLPQFQGRTSIREWIEQKIPSLVTYPLANFRVHTVVKSLNSRIPLDREVVVIDIEDSALAPHQCAQSGGDAKKYAYYYRQAGRSELAPHFYLELLRQRVISPTLEMKVHEIVAPEAYRHDNGIFIETEIRIVLTNAGRVAAYKWAINAKEVDYSHEYGISAYHFGSQSFPLKKGRRGGIRIDDTILPGCSLIETIDVGFMLRPYSYATEDLCREIDSVICDARIGFQIATETSPGDIRYFRIGDIIKKETVVDLIKTRIESL
jgi:hypothetical protein